MTWKGAAAIVIAVLTVVLVSEIALPMGLGPTGCTGEVSFNKQWAEQSFCGKIGQIDWARDGKKTWPIDLPFSFVYGGKPSTEFIHNWQSDVRDEEVDSTELRRTLTLTDPDTRLEVKAVATVYTDTPGVDWTLYFTNKGDKDTPVIEQVRAVDVRYQSDRIPTGEELPVLHRICGTGPHDYLPFDQILDQGDRIDFKSFDGRTALWVFPFFNVQWEGGGVITAVGWSGQWNGTVEHVALDSVRIQAGMERIHLKLHPGESIRSPRVMQIYWSGKDVSNSYNLFRHTMFNHFVPKLDGKTVTPPFSQMNICFNEWDKGTEADVLSHIASMDGLGFESVWMDAYWIDGVTMGVGNYGFPITRVEPAHRFPHGLKPIGDAAHERGMGFIVWFEPERVVPDSFLAKEHPEWISPAGVMYNLGNTDARVYMTRYLKTVIQDYGIDCLRIDFNYNPLSYWKAIDGQDYDRVGMAEIRYIEGLYRMWDDIRAAYPNLYIDNCASGGTRIDIETCSRSIPLWRTDFTTYGFMPGNRTPENRLRVALQDQVASAGLNRYVPMNATGLVGNEPYYFRSACNSGLVVIDDLRVPGYPKDLLKLAIAEGKRLRKYYLGNYYSISPITLNAEDWCVTQYHLSDEQSGMVLAFRRQESPDAMYKCKLREIDASADYSVTQSNSYEPGNPVRMKGTDLAALAITLEKCPGSAVIEYRRVGH